MFKRFIAPLLGVFAVVVVVTLIFMRFTAPKPPELTEEEKRNREVKAVFDMLKQWDALPAERHHAEAPRLVNALKLPSEDVAWQAAVALAGVGSPPVADLTALLDDTNPQARTYALWALGLIGPDAAPALPAVKKALGDLRSETRATAAFALSQIEARAGDAVPLLIPMFTDSIAEVCENASRAAARYRKGAVPDLRNAIKNPATAIRQHAVITLGRIGPDAADAIPDLLALLRDPQSGAQSEAGEALAGIGQPALDALASALQDPSDQVRTEAVDALGLIGKSAVATLTRALQDPNSNVRAKAVSNLKPNAADALDSLVAAFADAPADVREAIVLAVGDVGDAALQNKVVPFLVRALGDGGPKVRDFAGKKLQERRADPAVVLPLLAPLLEDKHPEVRIDALKYLALGGFGKPAVPLLARGLRDPEDIVSRVTVFAIEAARPDPAALFEAVAPLLQAKEKETVRVNALNVLWRAGPPAAPLLTEALRDPSPKARMMAIWALHQGTIQTDKVLPALAGVLKDDTAEVRIAAVSALVRHGNGALPHLEEALKDKETAVRAQAARVAGLVVVKPPAAVVPLLEQALKDDKPDVRAAAAAVLENVGLPGAPLLLQAFKDKDDDVWKQALRSLIRLKTGDKALLPVVVKALKDESPSVRTGAAYAMERFAGDAVEPLLALLKDDKDPSVHWAIVDVLDTIGSPAKAAFPELARIALAHPAEKVRYGALVAMLKMHGLGKYRERLTLDRYKQNIDLVVPELMRSLEDRDPLIRWQSAVVLGVIGPPSQPALPALTETMKDRDPKVAQAAKEAVERIKAGK